MKQRRALTISLFAATAVCTSLAAGTASAQSSAPIVYKTPDGPQTYNRAGQAAPTHSAATPSRPRIEFRYPDQPGRVYSENGVTASQDTAPIAFSSSTSAISAESARQYASVETPMAAREPAALDPAISPGGFDARATAERIAAQAALPAHRNTTTSPPPDTYSRAGRVVQPASVANFDETGLAGIYDGSFAGLETANGEIFDPERLSAAHPTLPLPSLIQVTNTSNGREIVVRVNDRGPFEDNRIVDLSPRAGELLGFNGEQPSDVEVRYLGPASVVGAASFQTVSDQTVVEYEMPALPSFARPAAPATVAAPAQARASTPAAPLQQDRQYPPARGNFFVQVGSFSNIANAQRLRASLDASLFIEVVPARVNGSDYFRVLIGPYTERSRAQLIRDDLAARGVARGMVVTKQ
ncbi:MAG: septal ring lytic transglycosylase RlpA family protein [Pseudomonadota bacterium]